MCRVHADTILFYRKDLSTGGFSIHRVCRGLGTKTLNSKGWFYLGLFPTSHQYYSLINSLCVAVHFVNIAQANISRSLTTVLSRLWGILSLLISFLLKLFPSMQTPKIFLSCFFFLFWVNALMFFECTLFSFYRLWLVTAKMGCFIFSKHS